ncbi:MAG: hypothetical protein R3F19_20055 [Verrucomicrobiales bacterium]
MKRKSLRKVIVAIGAVFLLYAASYCVLSVNGHYQPFLFGLVQVPDGTAIMAPKGGGYRWSPKMLFSNDGSPRFLAYIYTPLYVLDFRLWHTDDLVHSGDYRVKDYFDHETLSYLDYQPE